MYRRSSGFSQQIGNRQVICLNTPVQLKPFEEHFTPQELAAIWKLDETTIRRIFQDEPGVLKFGKANRRDGKRDYVTLRDSSIGGRACLS